MPFQLQQADPAIRYGFYLRPSYAISRAQAELHDLLKRQFGTMCGGVFMPHATIKGFFRSDASIEEITDLFDGALEGHSAFLVYNAGPQPWGRGRGGIALDVNTDGIGGVNQAMRAVHASAFNAILPLVHPECNFTFGEGALENFRAHLTIAMGDIPTFAFDEILDFVHDAGPIGEPTFLGRHFHLYAFHSDDWYGKWWETLEWQLLHTWTLPVSKS